MEFPDLGKHCAKCKFLDFLPFKCSTCNKYYCLDHRTKSSHGCPEDKQNIVKKPVKINSKPCSVKKCKNKMIIPCVCPECNKDFCIAHRHHTTHHKLI